MARKADYKYFRDSYYGGEYSDNAPDYLYKFNPEFGGSGRRRLSRQTKSFLKSQSGRDHKRIVTVLNGEQNYYLNQVARRHGCSIENTSRKVFDGSWFEGYKAYVVGRSEANVIAAVKEYIKNKERNR